MNNNKTRTPGLASRSIRWVWPVLMLAGLTGPVFAAPVWTANFDVDENSFTYADDTFRGTNSPAYATGARFGAGGNGNSGNLRVTVGGIDGATVNGMSGGYSRDFTIVATSDVTVDFTYNLIQDDEYENNEFAQVLMSVNGTLVGTGGNDYIAQVAGGNEPGTGLTDVSIDLGTLSPGTYTLTLGAYNNLKTFSDEVSVVIIDDVMVDAEPVIVDTTIAGTVYYDLDASGAQNGIEVGLAGARVNLHSGNDCQTPVVDFRTTDGSGNYSFVGIDPGTYCVSVWPGSLTDGFESTDGNNPTVATVADMELRTDVHFGFEATTCLPDINWETDAANNPLTAGDVIDTEFEPWGISITVNANGSGASFNQAMIFDSANPTGGDADVGTPNEDFGGPGVGPEGGTGSPTINAVPEGNVLIISEDGDGSDPDDNGSGGTITFTLDRPIEFARATLVDVEDDCGGGNTSQLIAYDGMGMQLGVSAYPDLEDNGIDSSTLDVANVEEVDADFCASGAIVRMRFCISPTNRSNAVGDRIWHDVDMDGVQDIGEPGIGNVEITLYDVGSDGMQGTADDVAVATTLTTNANGTYLFRELKDGTYYIDVTDATIPAGLSLTAGSTDPTGAVSVSGGQTYLDLDVGYAGAPGTAVIGDLVWSDADNDGFRDAGEPGIGGVTLDLVAPGPDGVLGTGDDVVADTVTTAADGRYLFINVVPGEYRVDVTDTGNVLTGYTLTTGIQSNPDPTEPITVIAGQAHLTADFGYFNPALFSISDSVWYDADQDALRDVGEAGFFGVTYGLLDDNGVIIATAISDAVGQFSFNGVPDGDYRIVETDVINVVQDLPPTTTGASNDYHDVTVAGANVSGDNFGYVRPGTIGDFVFIDSDGDGEPDLNEIGIPGVTVTLHFDTTTNGSFDNTNDFEVRSTVTDANGLYLFENLIPGTYYVTVDPGQAALTSFTATTSDQQGGGNAPGIQRDAVLVGSSPANLAASSFLEADFGFQNAALANISGNVWNDLDADGFDDGPGEPRIGNVQLDLLNAAGQVIATTFTDASGDYIFRDLPDGDYSVAVNNQNGVLNGYRLTSGLDVISVTLAGVDITDVDFGYVRNALTGLIGDYVWHDASRDGVQNAAEPGFPQVTVTLFSVGPDLVIGGGDDVQIADTVTDVNGNYVFMGLAAGKYYVTVDETTLPAGGMGLAATTGTSNPTGVIDLSEGEQYRLADFGYAGTAGLGAIGDEVWYDADSDGVRDSGEPGLAGVTVELRDDMGMLLDTTVTNAAGYYLFTDLVPGFYQAVVDTGTLPLGLNTTPTNNGGSDTYTVPLSSDRDELYADWGFDGGTPGAIGDTVFLDLDVDGTQDPDEEGIQDVTLNLVGPGPDLTFGTLDDDILATTTTNSTGNYLFSPLLAGDYRVIVTDVNNVLAGLNLSPGSFDSNTTISLAAAQNFLDADFGYSPSSLIGAIGNQVWHDLNNNGVFDVGEPGLEGVSLEIWVDNDNDGLIEPGTDNLLRERLTDFEGKYEFTGLLPENYLVTVTDRLNVLTGFTKTLGTPGLDNNSQVDPYATTLSAVVRNNQTADFGYYAAGNLAIRGTVFIDADIDGLLDGGETRVPTAQLRLYRDLDGDGLVDVGEPLIDTTQSDGAGDYLFDNLPPGDFVVVANVTSTIADGGEQTTQVMTSGVQPVELIGADSEDNDFGFVFRPTLALIKSVRGYVSEGQTVIEWRTHSESGVLSFDLYRVDGQGQVAAPVNPAPIAGGMGRDSAATYRVVDHTARAGEVHRYLLEETEQSGSIRYYGPYDVRIENQPGADIVRGAGSERIPVTSDPAEQARLADAISSVPPEVAVSAPGELFSDGFENHAGVPAGDGQAMKLYVRDSGIQYVSDNQIAQALGLTAPDARRLIAERDIALYQGGEKLPWHARDDRGLFFYAQAIDSIYTEENVYWLIQGEPALIMTHSDRTPAGPALGGSFSDSYVEEQDQFAAIVVGPDPESDYWHWSVLSAANSELSSATFTIAPPAPIAQGNPTITVNLRGATRGVLGGTHLVDVEVDGQLVGIANFQDYAEFSATYAIDPAALSDGRINVTLRARLASGQENNGLYVDGFSLTYRRALQAENGALEFQADADGIAQIGAFASSEVYAMDVTNPRAPRWVTGIQTSTAGASHDAALRVSNGERVVIAEGASLGQAERIVGDHESNLGGPGNQADYLIVAPRTLHGVLTPLVQLHQSRGLSVQVVDYQDVLDEFSFGLATPHALREFLTQVHQRWSPAPRFVLLVGAGSFDYRDVQGHGGNLIPPLMVHTPRGIYASDVLFADVAGDATPEFALGRLPVLNADELALAIDKTIHRYTHNASGRALLLADNPDPGGDFDAQIDQVRDQLGGGFVIDVLRGSQLDTHQLRAALTGALADGVSLMDYVGHGGITTLASEGFLTSEDVPLLPLSNEQPVLLALSCGIARFELPGFGSLAESLLLAPERGAVAVWAPSGESFSFDAAILNEAFAAAVSNDPGLSVGEAINAAHAQFVQDGALPWIARIYNLLGDPALPVRP